MLPGILSCHEPQYHSSFTFNLKCCCIYVTDADVVTVGVEFTLLFNQLQES